VPHPPRLVVDVSVVPSWTGSLLARHDGPVTHNIAEALQALAVDIDSLVCIEGNPRKGDIEAIAKSLHKFGQRHPLVFRADTREVEAGNHTLLAARSLGWTQVAAFAEEDDEATAKAFALADNRTHELGENDNAEIDAWLAEIAEADMELVEAAGYDIDEWLSEMTNADLASIEVDTESGVMPTGGAEVDGDAKVEASETPAEDEGSKPRSSSVTYTLVFDDEDQKQRWYQFGRWLKANQEGDTLAARLDEYLSDNIEL